MKNIIVFGATGNIGVYFIDYCLEHLDLDKYHLVAVGRKKTDYFAKHNVEYINVDVTNSDDFNKLPKDVFAIIDLAGVLPAYYQDFDPQVYVDVNIKGSINVLEYARKNHCERFIYTQTWSDQAGYWGKEEVLSPKLGRKLKYTGDHAFYSITKTMILDTLEFYHQEFGLKTYVFRLPNIYLYNKEKYYFVDGEKRYIGYRRLIDLASNGEDIEMWCNPNAFKDIIYVKDLCQMMYLALFTKVDKGEYNAGTGIKTTFREQVEGIIDVFSPKDKKSKIIYKPGSSSFTSFVMDIDNIKSELGYEPVYTYRKLLEDYKKESELKRFDNIF